MPIQKIMIVGGTSAIAEQVARRLATKGCAIYLTGRDTTRLDVIAADLRARGASRVAFERLDLADAAALEGALDRASDALDGLDTLLVAAGQLPDERVIAGNSALLRQTMEVNAVSAMVLLNQAAALFERQGQGQIVAIGSVAGDRGRAVNCAYGAAKGALEIFLSGLRQRLRPCGISVLLVKPGFVDTPMTANFTKGALWASPERVAQDIVTAMERRKSVIYTPWFWHLIMLIIRHIPEPIFTRLKF